MKYRIPAFFILIFLISACSNSKLLTGRKHYELGEYFSAVENLREVYPKLKNKDEKAEVVYKLGKSYEGLGEYNKATPWLKNATRYEYPVENLFLNFAEVQKAAGKLEVSAEVYGKILEEEPGDIQAKNGLRGIEMVKSWMESPSLYQVEKESILNSIANEKAIAFLNEEQILISSSREEVYGKTINPVDGQKFADLFVASFDSETNKWTFPEAFKESNINTEDQESHVHISRNGKKMVLSRAKYIQGQKQKHQLYYCLKEENKWGDLQVIPFTTDGFDYPQASWSADEEWIYFSSDRQGGEGGLDIWKAHLIDQGKFDNPIHLGKQINTSGDELYPLERSKDIIYFSSNFHPGAGAQDIFKARMDRGRWLISNMGFPVNSMADDFGIQYSGEKEKGFLLSNRKGSRGLDVYSFFLPPKLFMCFGKVFNDETDSIISNVNIRVAGTDGSIKRLVTNNGEFQIELMPDNEYTLIAYKKGFLNAQAKISTRGLNEAQDFQIEFKQTPTDKPILLEQIYYKTGKWDLLPTSKESLNKLIEVLQLNSNIQIEVSAHTDEVGEEAFNYELSEKRAKEVVRYLVEKGIKSSRLKAKGYGEKRPFVVNAKVAQNLIFLKRGDKLSPEFISGLTNAQQEIAKSLNRRTEFEVLGD